MQPIYRHFAEDQNSDFDFSEKAALEAYLFESQGIGDLKQNLFSGEKINGYVVGKHWMDATIKMWLEDMPNGLLQLWELYNDYPSEWHWWLDKFVKQPLKRKGFNLSDGRH